MTMAPEHENETAVTTPERTLRVAGAQIENVVGDLEGNVARIRDAMDWAEECEADVLLLPELALTGYPLEDLAVRRDFVKASVEAVASLARASRRTTVVLGTIDVVPPRRSWDTRTRDVAIGAALLCDGEIRGMYHKVMLPNYEVFDEARNFAPGTEPALVWRIGEAIAGISICEDSWSGDGPPEAQAAAGAQILLVPNASPFHREKPGGRLAHCISLARRNGLPVVYVNSVGGQDELVFDGGSMVVDAEGTLLHRAPQFETARFCVDLEVGAPRQAPTPRTVHSRAAVPRAPGPAPEQAVQLEDIEQVWRALVLGTRDFAIRNGTSQAVLGISGGIDSALTATVAADALGSENVLCLSMPVRGTPDRELEDARLLASNLGVGFETIPIDDVIASVGNGLAPVIEGRPAGGVRRDLLARMRGAVLQAVSDELGYLALATVNKTELSLGSATLQGDMAGGFAPLKDCPKTLLYDLARHRNARGPVIPEVILDRTPTALLADEVALTSFDAIDPILVRRLEQGAGLREIVAAGFDQEVVRGVLQLFDDSEQQRRQSPPGVKITRRAFGTDRRTPITNAWRPFRREQELLAPGIFTGPVQAQDGAG